MSKSNARQFEIDKLELENASKRSQQTSTAFFITLGFFITITGWFLKDGASLSSAKYLASIIGVIFMLLLINLSKVSHLAADNQDVIYKFRQKYRTNIQYHGTAFPGIADFIHYSLLSGITAFFLLYPVQLKTNQKPLGLLLIGIAILVLTYILLARGSFPLGEQKEVKSKAKQTLVYIILFTALSLYSTHYIFDRPITHPIAGTFLMIIALLLMPIAIKTIDDLEKKSKSSANKVKILAIHHELSIAKIALQSVFGLIIIAILIYMINS